MVNCFKSKIFSYFYKVILHQQKYDRRKINVLIVYLKLLIFKIALNYSFRNFIRILLVQIVLWVQICNWIYWKSRENLVSEPKSFMDGSEHKRVSSETFWIDFCCSPLFKSFPYLKYSFFWVHIVLQNILNRKEYH